MQLNNFNLYSINNGINYDTKSDFVDECRQELIKLNEYDEVKEYLTSKLGSISGEKWFDYPDLNKQVYVLIDEEKVEFCALKNEQQYFGKGWKLISKK